MHDPLHRLAVTSRDRVRDASARVGTGELLRRAMLRPRPPVLRLDRDGFDVIAEIKPSSPSAGPIVAIGERTDEACRRRAIRYAEAGACAISVLTEPTAFGGSLELLAGIAGAVDVPVMRKDVLVDPYQIVEARGAGAAGVLLIVRVLETALMAEMLAAAGHLGLFALVEAFDRDDLERAVPVAEAAAGTVLLGVNARDLDTLAVDVARFGALAGVLPRTLPAIAESGLATPEAAASVASLGYRGALIGEALMREADPRARLAAILAAGRRGVGRGEVMR